MTRSEKRTDAEPSGSWSIPTAVALAVVASLAWAGVAAAGPASSGEPPANGDQPDANSVGSDANGIDSDADAATPRPGNGSDAARSNGTAVAGPNGSEVVALDVTRVRTCGDRCRRVTANVTNTGNETIRNVTAETRIFAADSRIWTRDHRFGNLSANASAGRTAKIELSLGELFRVARNDGRVRIETTVRWAGGNATFTERRRVLDRGGRSALPRRDGTR
ncbi:hypothetical protein [Halosimplex halophilum]|uniref:hypothetical protein n=1 Tax=Halosimplex halophilum TaxID=2559572 RepID=UPI00107F8042|nr:hypothetical protein [Halosimplex halophilum]